jgi:DNA invertase Pin-like site-specific DNA recombinase
MLDYAQAGDTVVVAAIDRLGRSAAEATRTITDVGERRKTLCALGEGVDTGIPTGRAVAAIMAPSQSSNSGGNAARNHANPAARVACRRRNRPN